MQLMNLNKTNDPIGMLREEMHKKWSGFESKDYEPTGVQEEIIATVGNGKYDIILCLHNNKGGKTCTAVQILKNIIWPNDKKWFDYPLYNNWPFESKQGRICGTTKNTSEGGPIRQEILKWWPRSRYDANKGGKSYYCNYETDTGFLFDVMTYDQEPSEYEGPFLSWVWSDEPPPAAIVGAINTRMIGGGFWLVTATPINCGPFLSTIKDIEDRGSKVVRLNAKLTDFSITKGKPNSRGGKPGLWTDAMINKVIAGVPRDEYDARILGKANSKSGLIYDVFDRNIHVKDFPIHSAYYKASNCFMVMDPHKKAYPCCTWWMLTPDNILICYNEWPTKEFLGDYYDEVRSTAVCRFDPSKISQFIKIYDGTKFGLKIKGRAMDPRFGKATDGEYGKTTESLMIEYARYLGPEDPGFTLCRSEAIDVQRDTIRQLLSFDILTGKDPQLYIMPHCENLIRCLERHYWEEQKTGGPAIEREAEKYKDFVDTLRYLLAMVGELKYIPDLPKKKDVFKEMETFNLAKTALG